MVELIKSECPSAKVWGEPVYDGENLDENKELTIRTSISKINSVLGVDISDEKIISIFESLDFTGKKIDDQYYEFVVPSYRATKDIEVEADLIEEVGRIIGYDNISPVPPSCLVRPMKLSNAKSFTSKN